MITRELDPQPEIKARNTPDSLFETLARDAVADNLDNFIDTLLKSRDSEITSGEPLALASLASCVLDDLD
jgi:hypothetical protein